MHWPTLATISLLVSKLFFYYPCDLPVTYRLGEIDPRFNLSQTVAQKHIDSAVSIWGQQHFKQDPNAKLTINFTYDARQELVTQITTQESRVATDQSTIEARIKTFNTRITNYEQQVSALNAEIADWNTKGGAPEDIYHQLVARQQALATTRQNLQNEAAQINATADKFNLSVNKLNNTIGSFNQLLEQKPEEGLYDGQNQRIDIYFVNTPDELVHTLAHEFGHARGLDHINNSKGIMHTFSSDTLEPTPEDLAELTRACTRINKFKRLLDLLYSYTSVEKV